jgi:glyoxylase-like metal-dependent hydrolase (beta-lactamase superfamily II)
MALSIYCFQLGEIQNNTYLAIEPQSKKGMVVDPARGATAKLRALTKKEKASIAFIANTHGHWDHVVENALLQQTTKAKLFIHKADAWRLKEPKSELFSLPFKIEPSQPNRFLKEGTILKLGNCTIRVLHTPGHSPGSICLYAEKENVLFSGDTLFRRSFGRTDFSDGNKEEMKKSLKRLAVLPSNTRVLPGHGKETTIGEEPWLKEIK